MSKIKTTKSDPHDAQITRLGSDLAALKDRLARALADYQNLEKRFSSESSSVVKFANTNLLTRLLEVRDHLGLASLTGDPSLKIILSTFDKVLVDEGVVEIKTEGAFDPHTMECQETAHGIKDQIIRVIRPGYMLHDRVLRPARVVVGNGTDVKSN